MNFHEQSFSSLEEQELSCLGALSIRCHCFGSHWKQMRWRKSPAVIDRRKSGLLAQQGYLHMVTQKVCLSSSALFLHATFCPNSLPEVPPWWLTVYTRTWNGQQKSVDLGAFISASSSPRQIVDLANLKFSQMKNEAVFEMFGALCKRWPISSSRQVGQGNAPPGARRAAISSASQKAQLRFCVVSKVSFLVSFFLLRLSDFLGPSRTSAFAVFA